MNLNFKKSYHQVESIKEEECYDSLSNMQLYKLIRHFQLEKNKSFWLFMECLQKQVDQGYDWEEGDEIDAKKIKYWKEHLHYETLVQWCFAETTKRATKRRKD